MICRKKKLEKMPLLDCLLPVSNSEKYLEECIESILSQSFKDFRLLVYDGGSIDSSLAIIKSYQKKDARIHLISENKKEEIPACLNTLIKEAKSKYFAIQLPSDLSHQTRFEKQLKRLKNSSLVAIGSSILWDGTLIGDDKVEVFCSENPKEVLDAQLFSDEYRGLFMETAMYDTKAVQKSSLLNPKVPYKYDIEFHAFLQRRYPLRLANINEPLYTMRIFHGCIQEKLNKGEVQFDKQTTLVRIKPFLEFVHKRYFQNILVAYGYLPY